MIPFENPVGAAKGLVVAAASFLRALEDRTARKETYRAFGVELLRQGHPALAAIELERANWLGDVSEGLFAGLLDCYRRCSDREAYERTLKAGTQAQPKAARFRADALGSPPAGRPLRDMLEYPQWVQGYLEQGASGGSGVVWVDDALVCDDSRGLGVQCVDLPSRRQRWSFPLNEDFEPPRRNESGLEVGRWRQREVRGLERDGPYIRARYVDRQWEASGDGQASGEPIAWGSVFLDASTGAADSWSRESPPPGGCAPPARPSLPFGPIEGAVDAYADASGTFVLLEEPRVLRLDPSDGGVLWSVPVDDAPWSMGRDRVPLARCEDALLIPGQARFLTALDIATGRRRWRLPYRTRAPVDVSGTKVALVCGRTGRVYALKVPDRLEARRKALVDLADSQADARLGRQLLTNALDLDPSNERAYAALARRLAQTGSTRSLDGPLAEFPSYVPRESPDYAELQLRVRRGTPLQWTLTTGSSGVEGFAADEDRVYVLAHNRLTAVDKASGEPAWERPLAYAPICGQGVSAYRLALDGGRLFLTTPDDRVLGVDAVSGAVLWDRPFDFGGLDGGYIHHPAAGGGLVYATANAGKDGARCHRFTALEAADGRQRWRLDVLPELEADSCTPAKRLTPVIAGDRVYFPTDSGILYAAAAGTGRLAWSLVPEGLGSTLQPIGVPVVDGRTLFVLASTGVLYALDAESGSRAWARPVMPSRGTPTVVDTLVCDGGRLFVETVDRQWALQCADAKTGAEAWNRPEGCIHGRVVPLGGLCWFLFPGRDSEMGLIGLDPQSGKTRRELALPGFDGFPTLEQDGRFLYVLGADRVSQVLVEG